MSDIFQEVDEEVRRDKAAEFWKKYQNLILAAAALIVLVSAGFRYWQYERDKAAQAAGDQFEQALAASEAGKLDEAKAGLDKIAAEAPGGYRALAQMTAAGARAQSDPQGAIGAFDAIQVTPRSTRSSVTPPACVPRCSGSTSLARNRRARRR